jgi:hypothetical protein
MAHQHQLQSSRFELKHLVPEAKARAMRTFILNHLVPDAYTAPASEFGYSVRSLYLDTPQLTLRQQTIDGLKNRFKLRIRFYDDNPNHPAFLEIKRRENNVIRKERAAVTRAGVELLLNGGRPDKSYLTDGSLDAASALDSFCQVCRQIGAIGTVFVIYLREAYVLPNGNEVRLTFDRELEFRAYQPGNALEMPPTGIKPIVDGTIFEIKFTDRFPHWLRDMVYMFELERRPMPKYVRCVDRARDSGAYCLAVEQGLVR